MNSKEETQVEPRTDLPQSTASIVEVEDFPSMRKLGMSRMEVDLEEPRARAYKNKPEDFPSSNSSIPKGLPRAWKTKRSQEEINQLKGNMSKEMLDGLEDENSVLETPINPDEFIRRLGGLRGGAPLKRPNLQLAEIPMRIKWLFWLRENGFFLLGATAVSTLIFFLYRYFSSEKSTLKIEESAETSSLTE